MVHTEKIDILQPIICEGKTYNPGVQPVPIWLARYLLKEGLAIRQGKSYDPKAGSNY